MRAVSIHTVIYTHTKDEEGERKTERKIHYFRDRILMVADISTSGTIFDL